MKCKNCGKLRGSHIGSSTKDKEGNFISWCYELSRKIVPDDKRYFMKFEDNANQKQSDEVKG